MWTEREILFALHETYGVGWHTIQYLIHTIGLSELKKWLDCSVSRWKEVGLKPEIAKNIATQFRAERLAQRLQLVQQQGIIWITAIDEHYPPLLKQISQFPWVLYGKGDWKYLREASIGIVGTRVPTSYGKNMAMTLAKQLTQLGFHVTSGLARGIDAASHEGALKQGKTIAVMGTSFEKIYPAEHAHLSAKIIKNGIVITEYPLGTPFHPGLFPRRNRILAGITLGTVVVEAKMRSGAMITAQIALDENREVFAVPGPITSSNSAGTLDMIQKGMAKMVVCVQDIVEECKSWLTMIPLSLHNETIDEKKDCS